MHGWNLLRHRRAPNKKPRRTGVFYSSGECCSSRFLGFLRSFDSLVRDDVHVVLRGVAELLGAMSGASRVELVLWNAELGRWLLPGTDALDSGQPAPVLAEGITIAGYFRAELGGLHAAWKPLEQWKTENQFEVVDHLGRAGLRQVHFFGGAMQIAMGI